MNTFLNDVEQTILSSSEELLMGVELPNWPIDVEHWKKNDPDLLILYEEIGRSIRSCFSGIFEDIAQRLRDRVSKCGRFLLFTKNSVKANETK